MPRQRARYNRPSNIQTDVLPRRDFTNTENIVSSYFRNRKNFQPYIDFTGKYLNNSFDKRYENPRNNMYRDDIKIFDNNTEIKQNEANEVNKNSSSLLRIINSETQMIYSFLIHQKID